MHRQYSFYIYILTNVNKTVLYTGLTNNLELRLIEHWQNRGKPDTFTGQYNVHYLLFYEFHQYIDKAIAREIEIKSWRREKKCTLINSFNPDWKFLNEELLGEWPPKVIPNRY